MNKIISICFIIALTSLFTTGCKSIEERTGIKPSQLAYDAYNDSKNPKNSTDNASEEKSSSNKNNGYGSADKNSDAHFIQNEDYFISKEAYKAQPWIYVTLAKMTVKPTAQSKNEAQFMIIMDGNEEWTKYFWKSRIATKSDIKLGAIVIAFEGNNGSDIYKAPEDKSDARRLNWFMAKITDVSDLFKGYVTLSGGYKASVDNLRIPVK